VPPRLRRRAILALALKAPLLAVACSATNAQSGLPTGEAGDGALSGVTATPVPPTATPIPPTPTPIPPAVQGLPPEIQQGGTAEVVLNEAASSATLRFNGLQYPMIAAGNRSWTMVGVGAFADPGAYSLGVTYTGASGQSANGSLTILDKDYPVENINLDPQTSALLAPSIVANELARRATIYSVFTPRKLWKGPWVRPHPADLSDHYGIARGYNGSAPTDYHRGTDFAGQKGTPVVCSAAGKVAFAEPLQVRGNSVIVDHGVGVFSAYHHLSRIDVSEGQDLFAGQQVGLLGDTGLVTGPHLHWEVVIRTVEVDGLLWLDGHEWGL
jgi:hypothetical protein